MKFSLIGMSSSGKSYWSKKFKSKGFKRFCCDDLIEKKLGCELKTLGYSGIKDVGKWMGQPFDSQYPRTSKQYLAFEKESLSEILADVEKLDPNQDVVIDATGSLIYLQNSILNKLAKITRVIYLQIPDSFREKMYKIYLKHPKPVIWGNSFKKLKGETDMEALARCYPKLLAFRAKRYEKLADITLDYRLISDRDLTIDKFIQALDK
ncbi:hypothetical protein M1437_01660 [Patescibacteria group bacterium]|nr:hypothetical protein [Patescibacteria group bacterium]